MKRIVFILMAAVLFVPAVTHAAEITVRPATFDQHLDPGQSVDITVSIDNPGTTALILYPAVRDVVGMDENGNPSFAAADAPKTGGELSGFVTFKEKIITIPPKGTYDLVATVKLPANAPQGGLFGLVGVSQQPENPTGQTAVLVGMQTGTLVSLRVGNPVDDAKLLEFRADKWFKSTGDTTFLTTIQNAGTAMVRPYGVIEVRDMFGRVTATASFNFNRRGILPGATAKYTTDWKPDSQLFGRFTVTLAATYGEEVKRSLVSTATFWVFPVKLSAIVLGIAILLFLAIYAWVRSYIRRALRSSGSEAAPHRGSVSFFSVFIAILAVAAVLIGIIFFLLA